MSPRGLQEGIAWRPVFALRVLTLALLVGALIREQPVTHWIVTALLLSVVGLTASLVHFQGSSHTVGLVPVFEALVCVVLLSAIPSTPGLLGYLAVPPLAAGLTTGAVRCLTSGMVSLLALTVAALTPAIALNVHDARTGMWWVLAGTVAGLMASWQTRAERAISARQGEALRGRDLLTRFETTKLSIEALDHESQARRALDQLLLKTNSVGGKIVLTDGVQIRPAATTGPDSEALDLATDCIGNARVTAHGELCALPLRGLHGQFGAVVLRAQTAWSRRERRDVEELVNELAIPLDTALLFSRITDRATAAERSRLARDIHDTVAQDIASLGYLVDEVARSSGDAGTRQLAADLRREITRIVGELRYSIFDLRAGELSLASSITSHARLATERAQLQLHLDVESIRLSEGQEHVARQLQRIAQEAVTNTVRHARARHLWVRLRLVEQEHNSDLLLEIEDDGIGVGNTDVTAGFGLVSMRERAEAVGAQLEIRPRRAGGTVVCVRLPDVAARVGAST